MQKAISARAIKSNNHRLVNQEEMIEWRDPHCPNSSVLETGQCWLRNEYISLQVDQPHKQTSH